MSESIKYTLADRFIPLRSNEKSELTYFNNESVSNQGYNYHKHIQNNIYAQSKMLIWNQKKYDSNCIIETTLQNQTMKETRRMLLEEPQKILDAPSLRDDFYLNNLDWNNDGKLGVALDNEAYVYSTTQLTRICQTPFSYISSLKFNNSVIAIGTSQGQIEIYDLQKISLIRTILQHQNRVSVLQNFNNTLISGSKDKTILMHDLKQKNSVINKLHGHHGQICALKIKNNFEFILASGSNDNNAMIWDLRQMLTLMKLKGHNSAVKGLSWCPWKNGYLATGGGTGDKCIRLWNINTNQLISIKQTKSQVSALLWNTKNQCLISSHGLKDNQINVWKTQNFKLEKQNTVKGHRNRILNMVNSPDQSMICTASADQTLRFWKIVTNKQEKQEKTMMHLKNLRLL